MTDNEIRNSLHILLIPYVLYFASGIVYAFIFPRIARKKEVHDKMGSTFLGIFMGEFGYWLTTPILKLFKVSGPNSAGTCGSNVTELLTAFTSYKPAILYIARINGPILYV